MLDLPYEIDTNPTYVGYMLMLDGLAAIARNERKLGLFCSGTGIGKTFHARRECRRCGIKDVPEQRPNNEHALNHYLWLNRDKPVLLLDECDRLLRNETTANMLKVCNGDPRVASLGTMESTRNERWQAAGDPRYNPLIPASEFPLGDNARQAMLSNRNYQDEAVVADLPQEHWQALVGRGIDPVWVPTEGNDGRDLFEFTHWNATKNGMLRSLQFTYEVARVAVQYYVENIHRLVDIHPRRLVMIAEAIRDNPNPDRRMSRLNQMLRLVDQRPKLIVPQTRVLIWPTRPPPPRHLRRGKPQSARPTESKPPLDPHPSPPDPALPPVDREPLDHGDPAPGPEAAFDPATGVNNSAERLADLEFALQRQKALTTALHQQIIELTAQNRAGNGVISTADGPTPCAQV